MSKSIIGLISLFLLVTVLVLAKPTLDKLLPAADLGYLLKDGKYLVLFQNNNELRSTGGFIGSFATIELKNGRPGKIDFGTNIYKLDEPFTEKYTVDPPAPLARLTQGRWAFRDSNWAADGPEALAKVAWFYEQESHNRIDGVIGLTTTVVEELLRLTGPIDLPQYATTLSADNFAEVVQYKVEKEYYENRANWDKDEPKTILGDLIPILEEKLWQLDKKLLADTLFKLLDEKSIVLFAKDKLAERIILAKNWGGEVNRKSFNYIYLVNSNIDGGKSSRKIAERVKYDVDSDKRRVTLTIEREHTGSGLWPDAVNANWVRVLVPRGSRLIEAHTLTGEATNEVEVESEAGKTVFGFWQTTKPKEATDLTIIYDLPRGVRALPMVIQRQPGANADEVAVTIDGVEKFGGKVEQDLTIVN